ncbi:DDX11 [Cordylochernes scorpioides]|uniref:DDX11 n=1 Tax=Cordylochernes scorpioides TaxID=51811 RepID=A0ABY6K3B3_9ARAC|nr:DDX11 [Cordylochernes scorpioides]
MKSYTGAVGHFDWCFSRRMKMERDMNKRRFFAKRQDFRSESLSERTVFRRETRPLPALSRKESEKVGIFESPTGTGKSLSIICGSLKWLKDYQTKKLKDLETSIANLNFQEDDNDWFNVQSKNRECEESMKEIQKEYNAYKSHVEMKEKRKEKAITIEKSQEPKRIKLEEKMYNEIYNILKKEDAESEFVLDDYNSDDEESKEDENSLETEEQINLPRIIYCSRTHSQLSQFVREIQKSPYCEEVSVVTLGSRKNLCINESVLKLKHIGLINDKCRELQTSKSKTSKSKMSTCPFYKKKLISSLKENILVEVKDIEDIVSEGHATKTCPYYGTRMAVDGAEVLVVPYNTLLHRETREACGIPLKNSVVIIDEAHNLLEILGSIYSANITGRELSAIYSQLNQYYTKFYSRFNCKNIFYLKQLLFIISALVKYLEGPAAEPVVLTPNIFTSELGIDNINLYKIIDYCKVSKIAQKLNGYSGSLVTVANSKKKNLTQESKVVTSILNKAQNDASPTELSSPLIKLEEFLKSLTNASSDGRIVVHKSKTFKESSVKFLLLNSAQKFEDVVNGCRSLILAGGTMEPISEYVDQLFKPAGVPAERITHFSCGHIVDPGNLLALTLVKGPSGLAFDLSYKNRGSASLIQEVGRTISNLCNVVPGGIVVFFPSYDYEQQVFSQWEKDGLIKTINDNKKTIFREPKTTDQVDKVLSQYSKCIKNRIGKKNGALLLSVVGGKMSEGINFSDDMGRAVVMVGLPFPNIKSPELKEKMAHLDASYPRGPGGKLPSQVYYENLCMKAVNQSIGRAIRHKNDYAAILLLDERYPRPSIQGSLPKWIGSSLHSPQNFGQAYAALRKFFNGKKTS